MYCLNIGFTIQLCQAFAHFHFVKKYGGDLNKICFFLLGCSFNYIKLTTHLCKDKSGSQLYNFSSFVSFLDSLNKPIRQ